MVNNKNTFVTITTPTIGGVSEYHTKTPHERVTAFNDRIKKAADKLKDADSPMEKKMLQNKIKLAKFGLQNYKQQQALKAKAERERKAAQMKKEEVTQLTGDQREMVNGIVDILLQVKDLDNRMEMAKQQIQNFKDENINFNYAWFLSAAGLDNKDEPVNISTYSPTSTHISPVNINTNMKTTELKEQTILVRRVDGSEVEKFLKKYPKVKQAMSVIAKKNTDLMKGYKAFLKFKDAQEDYLGGRAEQSSSPTFGSKTFYKYDWGNLKGHWPEVYQYIYTMQYGGLDGATVESVNEIEYKDAVEKFNVDLMKNSQVQRIAQFHKRSVKDVVKALQPYLKVLRYNDKSIKVISIDFRDTNSDIKVHVSQTYKQNESINEDVSITNGDYHFWSKAGVAHLDYKGKEIASGDFDSDADAYFLSHPSFKGQKSFNSGKDVLAYFRMKGIKN